MGSDELRDELKKIVAVSEELRDGMHVLDKKLDLHVLRTELELRQIHEQDSTQNRLLAEHIDGVNTLRKMFESHDKKDDERFRSVLAPQTWIKTSWQLAVKMLAILGGIEAVVKILEYLKL